MKLHDGFPSLYFHGDAGQCGKISLIFRGGAPWAEEKNYNDEAAARQMNKVITPTQMVVGGDDVRVAKLESYLMERELHTLGVPNRLLIFPGEGHLLGTNPWHGKIKVREELKWLDQYDPR